tara:strand:+ start:3329 stop:4099 length:771 start_codon:yes stop_codon:yes gene_type:complete
MIDSHCHLDHSPLLENLESILARSKDVGIEKLLTISTSLSSYNNILNIINLDKIIYGTFGIHPHETDKELVSKKEIINKINLKNKIIGVGESGLDFYYNNSNKNNQVLSFKNHIEAALDLDIPIIVHSRNAEEETLKIFDQYKNNKLKILMHCFTGSQKFADKLLKYNSYFSASGIITFKNSVDLQNTFKNLPNDKILIETDSPFLAPVPMRGKKNEPSFLLYTLQMLAKLKNIHNKELDKITTNNFNNLFFKNAY